MLRNQINRMILCTIILLSNILCFSQNSEIEPEERALLFWYQYGIEQGNLPLNGGLFFKGKTESSTSKLDEDFCELNLPTSWDAFLFRLKKNDNQLILQKEISIQCKNDIEKRRKNFFRKKVWYEIHVYQTLRVENIEFTKIAADSKSKSFLFYIFYDTKTKTFYTKYSGSMW